jgi:Mrp family chromosome partitioning ATPase
MGYRVLVVEADMHNPDIQQALGQSARGQPAFRTRGGATLRLRATAGLRDILEGRIDPDGAVCRTSEGPDLITAGDGNANPADLLGDDRLISLISWAAGYDLIFFDSPPLDRHMDAGLLARRLDGALFCFVGGDAEFDAAASVARRLRQLGVEILAYAAQDPDIEQAGNVARAPAARPRETGR